MIKGRICIDWNVGEVKEKMLRVNIRYRRLPVQVNLLLVAEGDELPTKAVAPRRLFAAVSMTTLSVHGHEWASKSSVKFGNFSGLVHRLQ